MFGSPTLEAILGLLLTYVVLSWGCIILNELIASVLRLRTMYFDRGIRTLLQSPELIEGFYRHPLIRPLRVDSHRHTYLPARTFALALIDIISSGHRDDTSVYAVRDLKLLREVVANLNIGDSTGDLRRACLVMIDDADGDRDRFRRNVEEWFERTMDQVSGMYKRRTLMVLLFISLSLSFALNADSINIARTLSQNLSITQLGSTGELRAAPTSNIYPAPGDEMRNWALRADRFGIPLGWAPVVGATDNPRAFPRTSFGWFEKFFGILVTALALTLGATFWFDFLNKFVFVRSAFKPREQSYDFPRDIPAPKTDESDTDYYDKG